MKKIKPIKSKTLEASKETYDDLFADLNYYIKTKSVLYKLLLEY